MSNQERLEAENAALRELLAAIAVAADVPLPADGPHMDRLMHKYGQVSARRASAIAIVARMDDIATGPHAAAILRDRAAFLRGRASEPLGYEPESETGQ